MTTTTQTGGLSSQTLGGVDGAGNTNIIYGDAKKLKNKMVGGDDTVSGGNEGAINYLYGDAYSMEGKAKGGADLMLGGGYGSINYMFGDAHTMEGKVVGGNDILVGGSEAKNMMYGDAYVMRDGARGGDDKFYFRDGIPVQISKSIGPEEAGDYSSTTSYNLNAIENSFIGDASIILCGIGGNDQMNLGNNVNFRIDTVSANSIFIGVTTNASAVLKFDLIGNSLIGDAELMRHSKGGDDEINFGNDALFEINRVESNSIGSNYAIADAKISGSLVENTIIGDATTMIHSKGGADFINFGNNIRASINEVSSISSASLFARSSAELTVLIKDNIIAGDAINLLNSTGGDDVILVNADNEINLGQIIALANRGTTTTSSASVNFTISNNNSFGDAQVMSHSK